MYLIEILHQTTTFPSLGLLLGVVSYRNSTSNHNGTPPLLIAHLVVSYRNSTSNHNSPANGCLSRAVVSYRNSTSNHNFRRWLGIYSKLYLIEILHQTTTFPFVSLSDQLLYLIEILHQTTTSAVRIVPD